MNLDLFHEVDVLPIIASGTYKSGTAPAANIVDRSNYVAGVLFAASVGAITDAQTFGLNVSNTLIPQFTTATVAVSSVTTGTITLTITSALLPGGSRAFTVNVTSGMTAAQVAAAINAAFLADTATIPIYTVLAPSVSTIYCTLSTIAQTVTNDSTLNIAIAAGNGVTAAATSANTACALSSPYTLANGTDNFTTVPDTALATGIGIAAANANTVVPLVQYHGIHKYVQLTSPGAGSTGATYQVLAVGGCKRSFNNLAPFAT
jgi:hypothetical protein